MNRLDEIQAAGIREVVVFHSTDKELLRYAPDLPLPVVGDPHKKLYREFGIESSMAAALHPGVWGPTIRAVSSSMWGAIRRRNHLAPVAPNGGSLGLPGDFLIAPDGMILALKYGEHAYDQWSVDELLELARAPRPEPAPTADPAPMAEQTAPSSDG
ncbi:AhpC/TSA family protein [Streptomyces sp.]|uniref:AhpC/TSA family protein n=1 Tax=Streptomyces sp. TaxID=1931 RepID=UPI002F3FF026